MSEENNSSVTKRAFPTKEDLLRRFEEAKKKHQEIYNKALETIKAKGEKPPLNFSEKA
jgi:hypothetical protein